MRNKITLVYQTKEEDRVLDSILKLLQEQKIDLRKLEVEPVAESIQVPEFLYRLGESQKAERGVANDK